MDNEELSSVLCKGMKFEGGTVLPSTSGEPGTGERKKNTKKEFEL